MRGQGLRNLELEREHACRERLPVIVQAEAARHAPAERLVRNEVQDLKTVNGVALYFALHYAGIVGLEAIGGQLFLERRVELDCVSDDADVGGVAFVA